MRNNENTPTRSWKGVTRRLIVAGTSALMVASLMTPSAAFAAESISIDGGYYDWKEGGYVDQNASGGGTWSWSTAENLTLNNYNGGAISADGDLTVNYSGTNTVTQDDGYYAVGSMETETEKGNLTIKGDEDSTLNATGANVGIYSNAGDVNIDGGTVNVDSTYMGIYGDTGVNITNANVNANVENENDDVYGITTQGGVKIDNSNMKVNATTKEGTASGIEAMGSSDTGYENAGSILIKDSTVDVVASTLNKSYNSNGIFAYNYYGNANITIDASNVHAKAGYAISAVSMTTSDEYTGTITIKDGKIVLPSGGVVHDVNGLGKAATIGSADAKSGEEAASEVTIESTKVKEADAEPEAEITPASYTKAGEKKLAQTGDASAAGMFAAAAAGISALGAGAFLSRRRS